MTAKYIVLIGSLIYMNTLFAVMIKDVKFTSIKFCYSTLGKVIMLIPPIALLITAFESFSFIFGKFIKYFKP